MLHRLFRPVAGPCMHATILAQVCCLLHRATAFHMHCWTQLLTAGKQTRPFCFVFACRMPGSRQTQAGRRRNAARPSRAGARRRHGRRRQLSGPGRLRRRSSGSCRQDMCGRPLHRRRQSGCPGQRRRHIGCRQGMLAWPPPRRSRRHISGAPCRRRRTNSCWRSWPEMRSRSGLLQRRSRRCLGVPRQPSGSNLHQRPHHQSTGPGW